MADRTTRRMRPLEGGRRRRVREALDNAAATAGIGLILLAVWSWSWQAAAILLGIGLILFSLGLDRGE